MAELSDRMKRLIQPHLAGIEPYDPNFTPTEVNLSANENTYELPAGVRAAVDEALAATPLNRYPDPLSDELRDELAAWHAASGLPLRRFFNTSGMVYRERNVKALLDAGMGDEEAYALLAEDGMLVKRPLVVGEGFVLVGFKEAEWEQALLG